MSYKVLEVPNGQFNYRGVQRLSPCPADELESNSQEITVWKTFFDNDETFSSPEEAVRFLEATRCPLGKYEIVVIYDIGDVIEDTRLQLLGFDIVGRGNWNSLLSWNWRANESPILGVPVNLALVSLVHRYFAAKLNQYCLFADSFTASEFAVSVHAIARLAPGTFESPESEEFKVVGLATSR